MDKNKAVYEYLQTYPQLHNWLYFNTIINAPENASMLTADDVVLQSYIDGTEIRNYIFEVAFLKEYDTGTSEINADALEETTHFIEWIEEQNTNGNFPVFNENEEVQGSEVNNTVPSMAVDQNSGVARYTINVVISYLKERMERNG